MDRYLSPYFTEYSHKKIMLLSGPRQVGKTTYTRNLSGSMAYYNYDQKEHLRVFQDQEWDRSKDFVIFDELHKKRNWKLWLKGIFDSVGVSQQGIIVTGSARLDIAKKMGDSLAGRFFGYRLHPFDLKELKGTDDPWEIYKKLIHLSGFPEPYTEGTKRFYRLWSRSHTDLILRQDLLSLEVVKDLDSLEVLIELLSYKIGSTVSLRSLAVELQKDEKTIKKWITHLENLYIIFTLHPYSKKIAKGIKKSPKFYFYDTAKIKGKDEKETEAKKLENLVALSLRKEIDFKNDCFGEDLNMFFTRTQNQQEIDFVLTNENRPTHLIEVKLSDSKISPSLRNIAKYFDPPVQKIQLVKNLKKDQEFSSPDGIQMLSLIPYMENIDL